MANTCYLLLGSNVGDRNLNLLTAIELLKKNVDVVSQSSIYETEPWGEKDQPGFLNMAIEIKTTLLPLNLLEFIQETEMKLGRNRQIEKKWGPRTIDIDILLFGHEMIDNPQLKIPHPELGNRKFALIPLAEIAKNTIHPQLNMPIYSLLTACTDNSLVKPY